MERLFYERKKTNVKYEQTDTTNHTNNALLTTQRKNILCFCTPSSNTRLKSQQSETGDNKQYHFHTRTADNFTLHMNASNYLLLLLLFIVCKKTCAA